MSPKRSDIVSAQVVLRPAAGRSPDARPVTAATIRESLPALEQTARAQAWFARAGFEIGPAVGNSFAITGRRATFERAFGTRLRSGARAATPGPAGPELPLRALPADVASLVEAVTFTPPPAFGPTEFR